MTFEDINVGYQKILSELCLEGELKGKRKETPFLTFTLTNLDKNVLFFPFSQRNWPWILRECSDRLFSVKNPGTAFRYSKNWENRQEEGGLYSYHYSDRLNGQMAEMFAKKLHSRDKIVLVWDKADYNIDGRQPCTIILQPIMEADNKMSMVVYMRNNDMINIFPSDLFIHSTYLKFWCAKHSVEYKNIYWISAIAYYQKKRDTMRFVDRLLDSWEDDYTRLSVQPTHWTPDFIKDLELKEEIERLGRENYFSLPLDRGGNMLDMLGDIKSDYIREWTQIMLLAEAKKQRNKVAFQSVLEHQWNTEFAAIKNSIVSPR